MNYSLTVREVVVAAALSGSLTQNEIACFGFLPSVVWITLW